MEETKVTKTVDENIMETIEEIETTPVTDSKESDGALADGEYLAICNSTGHEVHVFDHDVNDTYDEGYKSGKTSGEKIAVVGIAAAVGAAFAIKKGIKWFKNRKKKDDEVFVEVEEPDEVIIEPDEN